MSENVHVISAAMIPFGKHRSSSYVGLAVPPLIDALRAAGVTKSDIDAVYVGHSYGGMMTGQRICKEIGLGTVPTVNVDNACSSGATAMHEAWTAISQGVIDVAVVIGVEKLTQFGGGALPLAAAQFAGHRVAVHDRHAAVADHQVKPFGGQCLQRHMTIAAAVVGHAELFQQHHVHRQVTCALGLSHPVHQRQRGAQQPHGQQ